jgi:hypothetical protein
MYRSLSNHHLQTPLDYFRKITSKGINYKVGLPFDGLGVDEPVFDVTLVGGMLIRHIEVANTAEISGPIGLKASLANDSQAGAA